MIGDDLHNSWEIDVEAGELQTNDHSLKSQTEDFALLGEGYKQPS